MSILRKSRILSIALIIVLVATIIAPIGSFTASAATSGYYTYTVSNGEATITDVSTSISGNITIPSTLGGYPVTNIGASAFEYCYSLTSITIPDSVTSIGDSAFYYCRSLTSITIPDSVTSIGNYAFYFCGSLTSIIIPDSVTSIGDNAFSYCDSLDGIWVDENNSAYSSDANGALFNKDKTKIICYPGGKSGSYTIPDSVTSIGDNAFSYCDSLTSITIPDSVTSIGDYAFYDCDSLTSITIPDSVTSIGNSAFDGCVSLTSITIPDSVTSIGDYAFGFCDSLTSIIIPDSVTSIGTSAFSYCESLTSITISDSVTSIGDGAFYDCNSLTSITIPDSVTSIGDSAFGCCHSLTSITIPDSVTSIGDHAFDYCSDDLTIYGYSDSYAQKYAMTQKLNFVELEQGKIKSVSHEIIDGKIIFTITTHSGDYDRVKLMDSGNLKSYIAYTKSYTVNEYGGYVWTIKADAPRETASYTLDIRSGETNKYLKEYYEYDVEVIPTIKSVSHEISAGKITFTVVTSAGDYNRVKLMDSDNLKSYVAYISSYTENSDGDYVWTIKADAPRETTSYTFDIRSSETNKYLKEYFDYEVEVIPTIKSVSHEIADNKIIFTITSTAGDFNRVKLMDSADLKGYIDYTKSYELNADGDYVWAITAEAPTATTNYVFDIRDSVTNKYLKDYFYYEVEVIVPTILNVTHQIADGVITFTVTTGSGDYNRVKLAYADNVKGYIAYTNSYTLDADGNYVWTIKADAPTEPASYAFDVRSSVDNNYCKDYYYYDAAPAEQYSYIVSNGEATITYYKGDGGDVVIPETLGGYPVTKIDYRAFFNCSTLTSVDLTNVTQVSWYAFDSCTSLKSVNMPNVTTVDYYAFKNCIALKSVTMQDVEKINMGAFSGCPDVTIYAPYNSCAREYANQNGIKFVAPDEPVFKDVIIEYEDDKIVFIITTKAGNYNRLKLMDADNLKGYLAYTNVYEVNKDGDYVWTIKIKAPTENKTYVIDLRSGETNSYLKDYCYIEPWVC